MEKIQSQSKNLAVKRTLCYIVLILLAFISLFPFYTMIINASRSHEQIQRGFSALPGLSLFKNFVNLTTGKGKNYPIITGMINSVLIGTFSAVLTTYFSTMTSYGIYMYNFKFKSFAFKFILAVMMVPTQVSTLGFLKLLNKIILMLSLQSVIAIILVLVHLKIIKKLFIGILRQLMQVMLKLNAIWVNVTSQERG